MSESRKDVLLKAIEAEVGGASVDLSTLFTDDVVGWSPIATMSGLTDVADVAGGHDTALSNVVITFRGLDEVGNKAFAESLHADFPLLSDVSKETAAKYGVLMPQGFSNRWTSPSSLDNSGAAVELVDQNGLLRG